MYLKNYFQNFFNFQIRCYFIIVSAIRYTIELGILRINSPYKTFIFIIIKNTLKKTLPQIEETTMEVSNLENT